MDRQIKLYVTIPISIHGPRRFQIYEVKHSRFVTYSVLTHTTGSKTRETFRPAAN